MECFDRETSQNLLLCPQNIFNKLSFRDFGELSRAVKREILEDLIGYKISPFGRDDNLIMGHDTSYIIHYSSSSSDTLLTLPEEN
jgi:hypothetical protein